MVGEPNFFGVGAAKSGTTAIWQYLKEHPEVAMPEDIRYKETCYFAQRNRFAVKSKSSYLSFFSHKPGARAVGEMCHAYLTCPESAEQIHRDYPHAKIFMVLRDPAERALSLYHHMVSHGFEQISSFERALEAEPRRMQDMEFRNSCASGLDVNYFYFASGLYSEQVGRYFSLFGRENVRVFLYDDLKRDPFGLIAELYSFLGVDCSYTPVISRHNDGRRAYSAPFQYFLAQEYNAILPRGASLQKKLIRYGMERVHPALWNLNLQLGEVLGRKDYRCILGQLRSRYSEDRARLTKLIGRDLSHWATG